MSDGVKKIMQQKITSLSDLPAPSDSIMKIMLLFRSHEVPMEMLITELEKNQSLVAQILKMINSSYFSMKQTIDSVPSAVTLLGLNNIKQLVYSASIMDMFSQDEKQEWNHSYTSSLLMTKLMKENNVPAASNLPITMLLHDIGKVALRRFSPKKYEMAIAQAQENNTPSYAFEDSIIQVTHAEAGAWLLETWKMTEDVIIPIFYHHSQTSAGMYPLETALVQFVNWVDNTVREISCDPPSPELMEEAGIAEIDNDAWLQTHREIIAEVEQPAEEEFDEQEPDIDVNDDGFTKTVRLKRVKPR